MCWQAISMKDPMRYKFCYTDALAGFHFSFTAWSHLYFLPTGNCSQELLEAVEEERNVQENHARTTTIFRHPLLGDFEVQHI